MMIYLNRTGYNGLFRLNSKGEFNVPVGGYENPQICQPDNLQAVAAALGTNVTLTQCDFEGVLDVACSDDFVYLDPPYAPLNRTSQFTGYTAGGFSLADQERLQRIVIQLASRGCWVLLSNSATPEIDRLYDGNREAEAVGLRAYPVHAKRAINSNAAKRGPVREYLITNLRAPEAARAAS